MDETEDREDSEAGGSWRDEYVWLLGEFELLVPIELTIAELLNLGDDDDDDDDDADVDANAGVVELDVEIELFKPAWRDEPPLIANTVRIRGKEMTTFTYGMESALRVLDIEGLASWGESSVGCRDGGGESQFLSLSNWNLTQLHSTRLGEGFEFSRSYQSRPNESLNPARPCCRLL